MEDLPLISVITSIPVWVPTVFLFIAAAGYFRLRSGSSYSLMNRLYALLIGGSEFHDDKLIRLWKERTDIERFNALFNMQAKSLNEIHLFQDWLDKNELDIKKFSKLRSSFDFEKRKAKKLKKVFLLVPAIFLIAALAAIQPIFFITSNDSAIIKLKGESSWIAIDESRFSNITYNGFLEKGNEWQVVKSECLEHEATKLVALTNLTEDSIKILCNSFESEEDTEAINKIINEQKSLWYVGFMYLFIAAVFFKELLGMIHTVRARPYLYSQLKKVRSKRRLHRTLHP